ncbi:MAG: cupin-like domain-containing protein [Hyphomonadaceae bacterium]|nr:MAG: transcription factor jumonji jmjC domain-containing protein [Caulobacteraceae bacterium]MBT9445677.1 cupin-like domain-containing protein [Hyphomonadaceae bacterium]TPW08324.1 MAG: transcription factor jumonji jmjC domain-containing protein [Alphaproteobacteria bacterium]
MKRVPERASVTPEEFHREILRAAQPVVLRGQVSDWPVVYAGRQSPEALCAYLQRFDVGRPVSAVHAPPSADGRFFYNAELTGFNFQQGPMTLATSLDYLLTCLNETRPPAFAVQGAPARANLPGFEDENPLTLLDEVEPRVWINNAAIVAAHHDPTENVACVVAGRRKFTLFPPEQIANLYMGPFEPTPAGATISMVCFENPDFERHPRFRDALDAGLEAELEPGDAIYIPYFWWHQVRSLERMNMLVNYWWSPPAEGRDAREALLHAMVAIRALPDAHRTAWRALFDHYVFEINGPPAEHLPPDRRGILGPMSPNTVRGVRAALARALVRPSD